MTGNLFTQVVPLLVAMALPFPMIKAILYLLAGRPVAHSLLMIVTWGASLFLILILAVSFKSYLLEASDIQLTYQPPADLSAWMHLALGLVFILIGVRKLRRTMLRESAPEETQALALSVFSIIKTTVHTAIFSIKNGLLVSLIVYKMINSKMALDHALAVSGITAITSMIWISIPLFVYVIAGRDRDRVLELLKHWLIQNKDALGIFVYLFIGISTLSAGIGELMPKLLDVLITDILIE